jgi:RNA polymerase sigma factor (sigma-70 family)
VAGKLHIDLVVTQEVRVSVQDTSPPREDRDPAGYREAKEQALEMLAGLRARAKDLDARQAACDLRDIRSGQHSSKSSSIPMKQVAGRDPADEEWDGKPDESELTPHDHFDREQQRIPLRAIMKKLPPRTRKVFSLFCESGLEFHEIAEQLDMRLSTVRTHVRHAMLVFNQECGAQNPRRRRRRGS